jgi:hypothetical protein
MLRSDGLYCALLYKFISIFLLVSKYILCIADLRH